MENLALLDPALQSMDYSAVPKAQMESFPPPYTRKHWVYPTLL